MDDAGTLNSTIAKNFSDSQLAQLAERMGAEPGDLLLFIADQFDISNKCLHALRTKIGREMALYDPQAMHFSWVVEFPMFEWSAEENRWVATHHPFTAPCDQDLERLESEPGTCRAKAYDLVINGSEAGGGTIRNHNADIQRQVLGLLGIDAQMAEEQFGFLLRALKYGAPPHGGIALGIDRWVMLFARLDNIRDCIAFPKTQRAMDMMTHAPNTRAAGTMALAPQSSRKRFSQNSRHRRSSSR